MSDLLSASNLLRSFTGTSLKKTVGDMEAMFIGKNKKDTPTLLKDGISIGLLEAAILIKRSSSQINELLHSIGIMLCLTKILNDDEIVISLSLAAGNTGKGFDLETTHRIAEFTFID